MCVLPRTGSAGTSVGEGGKAHSSTLYREDNPMTTWISGPASDILAPDLNLASSKNRRNTFEQTIQVLATGARAQLCRQHKTRPGGLEERTPACEAGQEEMMFIVLFQNQTGQSSIYES